MKERVLCFLGDGGSFEGSENYGHRQMLPSLFVFSCFFLCLIPFPGLRISATSKEWDGGKGWCCEKRRVDLLGRRETGEGIRFFLLRLYHYEALL